MLSSIKKGVAKEVPEFSWWDKKEPVTLECMSCLFLRLDLTNAKDAAVYSASSVFHGICRSANTYNYYLNVYLIIICWCTSRFCKLCISTHDLFNLSCHVTNSTHIEYSTTSLSICHTNFDISWCKTTGIKGAKITITNIDDTTPVVALRHHKFANANVPSDAPLFTFETADSGWKPLTKVNWLKRCNQI
jgi:hypothetical protein